MTRGCCRGVVRRRKTGPRRTAGRPVRCLMGILVLVSACAAIAPSAPPRASASAERLAARFDVGRRDYTFVDASRPNDARDGAHASLPGREFRPCAGLGFAADYGDLAVRFNNGLGDVL